MVGNFSYVLTGGCICRRADHDPCCIEPLATWINTAFTTEISIVLSPKTWRLVVFIVSVFSSLTLSKASWWISIQLAWANWLHAKEQFIQFQWWSVSEISTPWWQSFFSSHNKINSKINFMNSKQWENCMHVVCIVCHVNALKRFNCALICW